MAADRDRRAGRVPQRLGAERIGRSCSLRVGIWRWTPSSTARLPGSADHWEPRRRAYPLASLEAQRMGRSDGHPRVGIYCWVAATAPSVGYSSTAAGARLLALGQWPWSLGPRLTSRPMWPVVERFWAVSRHQNVKTAVHRPASVSLVTGQMTTDKPRKRGTVKMGAAQRPCLHAHIRRVLGSGRGSAPPGVRSSSPGSGRRRPRPGSPCRRPPGLARRWRRR